MERRIIQTKNGTNFDIRFPSGIPAMSQLRPDMDRHCKDLTTVLDTHSLNGLTLGSRSRMHSDIPVYKVGTF